MKAYISLPTEDGNNTKTKPIHTKIDKIQGLRGIAIISVLLFHIRPKIFKTGYLGVDVFFLISGYLMSIILSRHQTIEIEHISDFYFRRIKRIFPIYLFLIFLFQFIAIIWWLSPLDYKEVYLESIKPLFFISNINNISDYFARSVKFYKFFSHLWSLAVEIQFYLIVPFLMFGLSLFRLSVRLLLVILIALFSITYQINSIANEEHMALYSRIWQFMFGFIAFYINQNKLKFPSIVESFLSYLSTAMLIAFLSVGLIQSKPITRLLLLSCTVLILIASDSNYILCNKLLTQFGDVSYSVYIIHWPLFEWHRYWGLNYYLYGQTGSDSIAIALVIGSILFGFVVEKSYIRLSKYIKSWKSLILTISLLYLMALSSMLYFKSNGKVEKDFINADLQAKLKNATYVETKLMDIIYDRDKDEKWSIDKVLGFNEVFKHFAWNMRGCVNRKKSLIPTKYNLSSISFDGMCQQKGNGTKNIVLLGNSIARAMFYGIEKQFRGIYKNLSVLFIHQCFPIRMEEKKEIERMHRKAQYESCLKFVPNLGQILKLWNYPIDIIIFGFSYHMVVDPPVIMKRLDKDIDYQKLQSIYSSLSNVAREVVFVPVGHIDTGLSPYMEILKRQLIGNRDLSGFRSPLWFQKTLWPNAKKRIRLIKCPKCLLIDWEKSFCSEKSGYCDTFDAKRKLAYFIDTFHHNALGSMKVAKYVREMYDNWLVNSNKTRI